MEEATDPGDTAARQRYEPEEFMVDGQHVVPDLAAALRLLLESPGIADV